MGAPNMNRGNTHKDPTAAAAMGAAGDSFTAMLMQKRARAREETDRLRNERLRRLREATEIPDGAA